MATEAARTDQYDIIEEPVAETDNSVEARKAVSDKLLGIHNVISNRLNNTKIQFIPYTYIIFYKIIISSFKMIKSLFPNTN